MAWLLTHVDDPHGVDDPCVVWPFARGGVGYGMLRVEGTIRGAHVALLELRDGPAPPAMEACHGPCHNRACITHVHWGTRAENVADTVRDGTWHLPTRRPST